MRCAASIAGLSICFMALSTAAGLYLVEELRRLANRHSHLEYTPAVLNGIESDGIAVGPIDQVVLKRFPKLSGWRGYICGDPELVKSLKKKLFLSGMASRDIYSDAFLPGRASWLNTVQLSLHADYALRVLIYVGTYPDRMVRTQEISDAYGISKHHLVRVIHTLSGARLCSDSCGAYRRRHAGA